MSYDKRYSDKEIQRIRQWASGSMFFVMLMLCIGVGKVAYWLGHQNGYVAGYNERMKDDVINPVTSFVPAPPKAIAARLDIEPIPEPKKNLLGATENPQLQYLNWGLKLGMGYMLLVAVWCFGKAIFWKQTNEEI